MIVLDNQYLYELSKEFTALAIQNGLIEEYPTPEETAKAVASFYKSVWDSLSLEK